MARIKEACDPAASADLAAVMIEDGMWNLCLVGSTQTVLRTRMEVTLPRKRGGPEAQGFEKAQARLFEGALQAVLKHVDFSVVRCLVLAGPGFAKAR